MLCCVNVLNECKLVIKYVDYGNIVTIDGGYFTAVFLTSNILPYTVALWNKTIYVSDEMMSALSDYDGKVSTDNKTEVTFNESDTYMPVLSASKYPEVVLPTNEQPRFVAAVVDPGDYYVQLAE
ncbi:hypothetical protein LSAT2_024525, partial [Lamellibrachia satsuma]